MDLDVLQKALRECAERTTVLDVYVVHHALNFAIALDQLRQKGQPSEGKLCELIGVGYHARAERCEHCITHPSHQTVERHVRWIVGNLPEHDRPGKRSRWIGFAAGASSRIRLPKGYYCKDIADPGDIGRFVAVAALINSSKHLWAHVGLGYLQGWLWAQGNASIDAFRQMNAPPTPALAT